MANKSWQPSLAEFRKELETYDWFRWVGLASTQITNPRVDFDWMVQNDAFQYSGWGDVLLQIEGPIDRAIRDSSALDLHDAAFAQAKLEALIPMAKLDALLLGVDDRYSSASGYYGDTNLYPHEILWLPKRLIAYATIERGLNGAVAPSPVISEVLSIFSKGFWPAGWRGAWPAGTILVW
jgi:hypothetical protein